MRHSFLAGLLALTALSGHALADVTVPMHQVNAEGMAESAGTVVISETQYGLVFTPDIQGLAPGIHGFHVHEKPSCEAAAGKDGKPVAAGAAGGHYDPDKTGKHGYPWGEGHMGDLPALYVDDQGKASNPVLAPRIKQLSDVSGRAIMVHKGGDNHADHPKPLGGGGERIACGVIP
jgi:Cu-Zn family superoxide dismutase